MTLHLSVASQIEKTELLADAFEKLSEVRSQINALNAMIEAGRNSVYDACNDYAASVAKLEQFSQQIAEQQSASLAAQPARWKETDHGLRAIDWIGFYKSYKPQIPRVELPSAIDAGLMNDDLLSNFEELPDCP